MASISIEYHEAKKNYNAVKYSARYAEFKENNKKNSLIPTFDNLVAEKPQNNIVQGVSDRSTKRASALRTTTSISKSNSRDVSREAATTEGGGTASIPPKPKTTVQLPPNYNTAKLMYRASKSRAVATEGTTTESGVTERISSKPNIVPSVSDRSTARASTPRRLASISLKANTRDVSKIPATSERSVELASAPPTVESGLKALGLLRPIDNKTYEFGLANGIRLHLVESVKLCGLKKAREKSIMDMISTLCNHLTSKEEEISRWIEFADRVALSAAEKLDQSMLEYQAVCKSRDEAQNDVDNCQRALLTIDREFQTLKKDILMARDGVSEVMSTFHPLIRECEDRLRHEVRNRYNRLRHDLESQMSDVVEELKTSHDGERQRLSQVISALENSNRVEGENAKSLRIQLDFAATALEEEKSLSLSVQDELKADADKARNELRGAIDKIEYLGRQLESERIQKKKELDDVEEKMRAELDAIDQKVKLSFKCLIESKNKAVDEALGRARAAEASANAAHKLLSDLRSSVVRRVSASETTSES
ncbi:hypothetical protein ACHAW5_001405 [Stephanodiscus triporus]|uniref:Uncharacterized protein n=1 Tax=Stephanodiscus triporus TaxID=2934178 RepID=A0ABD3PZL9_9STRA